MNQSKWRITTHPPTLSKLFRGNFCISFGRLDRLLNHCTFSTSMTLIYQVFLATWEDSPRWKSFLMKATVELILPIFYKPSTDCWKCHRALKIFPSRLFLNLFGPRVHQSVIMKTTTGQVYSSTTLSYAAWKSRMAFLCVSLKIYLAPYLMRFHRVSASFVQNPSVSWWIHCSRWRILNSGIYWTGLRRFMRIKTKELNL